VKFGDFVWPQHLQNAEAAGQLDDAGELAGFDAVERLAQLGAKRGGIDAAEETAID